MYNAKLIVLHFYVLHSFKFYVFFKIVTRFTSFLLSNGSKKEPHRTLFYYAAWAYTIKTSPAALFFNPNKETKQTQAKTIYNTIKYMERLTHECAIAMVRLLKPLSHYQEKYGTWMYGLSKLMLLLEKQHNRGQDGSGITSINTTVMAGNEYLYRERVEGSQAINTIFSHVQETVKQGIAEGLDMQELPFAGQILSGHNRYSTTGKSGIQFLHPFVRRDQYRAKTLSLCGNFNLSNTQEVFDTIVAKGQHPRLKADTHILLEQISHRLDREADALHDTLKAQGLQGLELTQAIEKRLNLAHVFRQCVPSWDGGFCICAATGSGHTLCVRDPWGIRPAFWYADDEILLVASERPVIQTAMNIATDRVHELQAGQALLSDPAGHISLEQIVPPQQAAKCTFERIYFSRGTDQDIYQERKQLGYNLAPQVIEAVHGDIEHTVVSFIPNTAEMSYYGMVSGLNDRLNQIKANKINTLIQRGNVQHHEIDDILCMKIRSEKVAVKDVKLRTFITEEKTREDLSAHVYDITYGSVRQGVDNLVAIDDSIVRGTTLKESIIKILNRLQPKRIVFVSSSPMVKYPDFYGIDMQNMSEFIAFRAAIELLHERGLSLIIEETYQKCLSTLQLPKEQCTENYVKAIYAPFSDQELSEKIAQLVRSNDTVPVTCLFQTLEGLHQACPNHTGDWYFSGNYPTPGGLKRVNQAFTEYYETQLSK